MPWRSSTEIGRAWAAGGRDGDGQRAGDGRDQRQPVGELAAEQIGEQRPVGEARGGDAGAIDRVAALDLAEHRGGEFDVVDAGGVGGRVARTLVPGVLVSLQEGDDVAVLLGELARSRFPGRSLRLFRARRGRRARADLFGAAGREKDDVGARAAGERLYGSVDRLDAGGFDAGGGLR